MATPMVPKNGNITGGIIGVTGTSLYIKINAGVYDFSTKVENFTGAGDSVPQYISNQLLYGAISVNGWAIAGQSTGALNAIRAGTAMAIILTLDTGRTVTGTLLVSKTKFNWRKEGASVPMALNGLFTGTLTEA